MAGEGVIAGYQRVWDIARFEVFSGVGTGTDTRFRHAQKRDDQIFDTMEHHGAAVTAELGTACGLDARVNAEINLVIIHEINYAYKAMGY